jgi:hypothetical protein
MDCCRDEPVLKYMYDNVESVLLKAHFKKSKAPYPYHYVHCCTAILNSKDITPGVVLCQERIDGGGFEPQSNSSSMRALRNRRGGDAQHGLEGYAAWICPVHRCQLCYATEGRYVERRFRERVYAMCISCEEYINRDCARPGLHRIWEEEELREAEAREQRVVLPATYAKVIIPWKREAKDDESPWRESSSVYPRQESVIYRCTCGEGRTGQRIQPVAEESDDEDVGCVKGGKASGVGRPSQYAGGVGRQQQPSGGSSQQQQPSEDRGTGGRQRKDHMGVEGEMDEHGEPIVLLDSFGRPRPDRSSRSQESDERHHRRRRYDSPEGDQLENDQLGIEDQCADPQCKDIGFRPLGIDIYCRGVTKEGEALPRHAVHYCAWNTTCRITSTPGRLSCTHYTGIAAFAPANNQLATRKMLNVTGSGTGLDARWAAWLCPEHRCAICYGLRGLYKERDVTAATNTDAAPLCTDCRMTRLSQCSNPGRHEVMSTLGLRRYTTEQLQEQYPGCRMAATPVFLPIRPQRKVDSWSSIQLDEDRVYNEANPGSLEIHDCLCAIEDCEERRI